MSGPGVLALPRDSNPYQELLYAPMRRGGRRVRYAGSLTRSHTLNLLGLPLELLVGRVLGYRLLHVHWTFGFHSTLAGERPMVRRACRAWFALVRRTARASGMAIVWTAHNTLPHAPVFDDDLAARRGLVSDAALVLAHHAAALRELDALGLRPRAARVVPHGPIAPADVLALPAPAPGPVRRLLCFGRIEPYKGVAELAREVAATGDRLSLRVVGRCTDPELRRTLEGIAASAANVELHLGHASDAELTTQLGWADVVAMPFRQVTTSGSVMLAMASGRPVLVPDLPALDELPDAAVLRFSPDDGLPAALRAIASAPGDELRRRGVAARAHATRLSWDEIAAATEVAYAEALAGATTPDSTPRP